MVDALQAHGHVCQMAWDREPQRDYIERRDCVTLDQSDLDDWPEVTHAITNPPFLRADAVRILDAMISWPLTSIVLAPLDWLSNIWFQPYAPHVHHILPIGRVTWFDKADGSKGYPSTENFCFIWLERQKYEDRDPEADHGRFLIPRV